MSVDNPFTITVQDKGFTRTGGIGNPKAVKGQVKANDVGLITLTLRDDDTNLPDLLTPGARCRFDYRAQKLMTGTVRVPAGKLRRGNDVTVQVEDDARVLRNTVALVRPAGNIVAASLTDPAQAWQTGTAGDAGTITNRYGYFRFTATTYEGAIKELIQASLVTRLGAAHQAAHGTGYVPVAVAPDQGRGGAFPTAQSAWPLVRMGTLAEAVAPLLTASGLRLDVFESGGVITVDVAVPGSWSAPLTLDSGVVADGDWSITPPTGTRFMMGGPGEDAARAFWAVVDTAREAQWGDVIEVFRDATGATLNWPDGLAENLKNALYFLLRTDVTDANKALFTQYQADQSRDALLKAAALTSLSAQLAESEGVYFYGAGGLQLLDAVSIDTGVLGLGRVSDRIVSADLDWSANGLVVAPNVGNAPPDSTDTMIDLILGLATAVRRISRDR